MTGAKPLDKELLKATGASAPMRPATGLPAALKSVRAYYRPPASPLHVGYLDNVTDWQLLEPWWDDLLARTPGATVFSSYAYLNTWWRRIAPEGELFLVVVLTGDAVQAIAPMFISPLKWLGRKSPSLRFLGMSPEVDRPVPLIAADDHVSAEIIADYLFAQGHRWDCALLLEQQSTSELLARINNRLRREGFLVTLKDEPPCLCVDVSDDWETYLANRSRPQRKSIRRHLKRLRNAGRLELEGIDKVRGWEDETLERYLQVENRSWKRQKANLGIGETPTHFGFYQALVRRYSPSEAVHFRFLRLDGEDIAATFGLLWNGCFYSLQIAHDASLDAYSPGFVLTALELEEACQRPDYTWINYLGGGAANNKRGWATDPVFTKALYAHRSNLTGRSFHTYHFHAKPWVRRQLDRAGLLEPIVRLRDTLEMRYKRLTRT